MNTFFKWLIDFNNSQPYIDLIVVMLVIAGGFFAKRYFSWVKMPMVFVTLVAGTVLVLGYLFTMHLSGTLLKTDAVKYFISYAIATSFYEILIKWLIAWIIGLTKKVNNKAGAEDENNIVSQSTADGEEGGERPPKKPINP